MTAFEHRKRFVFWFFGHTSKDSKSVKPVWCPESAVGRVAIGVIEECSRHTDSTKIRQID